MIRPLLFRIAHHPWVWGTLRPAIRKLVEINLDRPESRDMLEGLLATATGARPIYLDYPVDPRPRYGHGLPSHPGLTKIIARGRDDYAALLRRFLAYREKLLEIPRHPIEGSSAPAWINGYLPGLDTVALYGLLAERNPARYIEIGSGNSTRVARRAIDDHGLRTRIISLDPAPRAEIDRICDEVVRSPVEQLDPARFAELEPGDVLFVDHSHRVFMNSDSTVVFLDVLPRLVPGVLIQIHDIFLPDDYPPEWAERFYAEQYLLAAALLAGGRNLEILLPCAYVSTDPELASILDPLWNTPALGGVERHGVSFWMVSR